MLLHVSHRGRSRTLRLDCRDVGGVISTSIGFESDGKCTIHIVLLEIVHWGIFVRPGWRVQIVFAVRAFSEVTSRSWTWSVFVWMRLCNARTLRCQSIVAELGNVFSFS
jgi:hypothetical protein